jgi:hypothetical protein
MAMRTFSFKKTFINGIALALPLSVVAYVVFRIIAIFEKIITPFAKSIGVDTIFGEITLTLLAIISMLIIAFILGLFMRFSFVANIRRQLETMILQVVPSLNHLKLLAAEKLDLENAVTKWKPVLVKMGEEYLPAYLIEEAADWISIAKVKAPTIQPGDTITVKKTAIQYIEISMNEMRNCSKQFGKGYISLIGKIREDLR